MRVQDEDSDGWGGETSQRNGSGDDGDSVLEALTELWQMGPGVKGGGRAGAGPRQRNLFEGRLQGTGQ